MKKIKLFIAAMAAVFAMNATAQTWTGSDPAEGTFFLYNVGAKKFINVGDKSAGWGTNAYLTEGYGLDFIFEANEGAYNLNSLVTNGGNSHYLNTGLWCDQGATPWTFTKVDRQDFNAYTIKNGDNYIVANSQGTDIEYTSLSNTERDQWQIIGRDDILANLAANTAEKVNRTIATFFISDPDFGRNDLRQSGSSDETHVWKWTREGGNVTIPGRDLANVTNNQQGSNLQNYGCEFWNNVFDIHQDLTNLPPGIYEFEIYGYGTNGTSYIYATTTEGTTEKVFKNQTSAANFTTALNNIDNYAGNATGLVRVTDGKLTIGVKRTENRNSDWCVIDQARLYYYGNYTFAECYGADLKDRIDEAKEIENPTNVLTQAISAAETVMTTGTQEQEFTDAMSLLNAAIDYNTAIANAAQAKTDNPYVTGVVLTNLNDAIAATPAQTKEDIDAKTAALNNALVSFAAAVPAFKQYAEAKAIAETVGAQGVETIPTTADEAFTITQALNVNIYNKVTATYTYDFTDKYVGEWTNHGMGSIDGQHWSGDGEITYMDSWRGSAESVNVSQTISLPAGKFVLKVAGRGSANTVVTMTANEQSVTFRSKGDIGFGIDKTGAANFEEGDDLYANNNNGRGWEWRFIPLNLEEATDVEVTLNMDLQGNNWASFTDFSVWKCSRDANSEEYTALNNAITTAEGNILGFDIDEYAPYKNVEALKALEAAKAINQEAANEVSIVTEATEALTAAVWTANTEEMQPIYNGMFAEVTPEANYPLGWTRTNGWGQMIADITGSYATAYYNQPGSMVYGKTTGYTLPLKANRRYTLTVYYRSHEENSNTSLTLQASLGNENIEIKEFEGNGSTSSWAKAEMTFKTKKDVEGNYIITISNGGNTWMTNVSLKLEEASDELTLELIEDLRTESEKARQMLLDYAKTASKEQLMRLATAYAEALKLVKKADAEIKVEYNDVFNALQELKDAEADILNGPSTGIDAISAAQGKADIFNVNGQKVNTLRKGIYVINGKKVVK